MIARDFTDVVWRRSSYSNFEGNCVEVAWRKSSHSNGGVECVEVAQSSLSSFAVRDSKNPAGPILTFPAPSFALLLAQRQPHGSSVFHG